MNASGTQQTHRNNDDLAELIERLIEGQPAFDDRLHKQLLRAHEHCCKRPLNSRTSECYDLCLTTLDMLSKSGVMGFELHFMRGAVQLCMGMDYATAGSLAEAGERFKESQKSFRDAESPDGEALAYVGLARTYYDRDRLSAAQEEYQHALIKIESRRALNFELRQLRKQIEGALDEIEARLVAIDRMPEIVPPPGIRDHGKPLPVIGDVKAGYPGFLVQSNVAEWVVVDDSWSHEAQFVLRVDGESMIGAGIRPGDYALIRPQPEVEPKRIAAVLISCPGSETEGVLKHVQWKDTHWLLESENDAVQPMAVVPEAARMAEVVAQYAGKPVETIEGTVTVAGRLVAVVRLVP
jgi:repressor LexA